MVEGQEVKVIQQTQKDETGTISKTMTRQDVQDEMVKQIQEIRKEYDGKLTDEQKAAADKLLNRLQQFIAMANMFLNAMISDCAATTTYNIEAQFKLAEYLHYQAEFNDQLSIKLDTIEAAVLEIRRK